MNFFYCHKFIAVCFLFLLSGVSQVHAGNRDEVALGHFITTDTGIERGFAVSGRAMLVRRSDAMTEVYSQVLGLTPLTVFSSHVHDLPCALGGGAHYKIDPLVVGTIRENEIWPLLNSDEAGIGHGFDEAVHLARPEAQSIVVHDPADGARIACADLVLDSNGATVHKGKFKSFAAGIDLDLDISGVAQMVRSHGTTYATANIEGLSPDTQYSAHVHSLPCGINNAGGHYKIDPFETAVIEENEIWPGFTTDASGAGIGTDEVLHVARPEAQSLVVHAPNGDKIACAPLIQNSIPSVTKGKFSTTSTGLTRGFNIRGSVVMKRKGNGSTFVWSKVRGLQSYTTYPSHVHNLPCRLGGGAHYKIDTSEEGVVEANEIWPTLKAYHKVAIGFAKAHDHTARPEAQSVVIHDPEDGARLACADLD